MTLWALMNCPSALSVTSTRDSSSRRLSKTEKRVDLWLFHLKQNCWSLAILNWAQEKIRTEKVLKFFCVSTFCSLRDQLVFRKRGPASLSRMSLATKVRAISLGKIGGGSLLCLRYRTAVAAISLTQPTPLSRSSNLV